MTFSISELSEIQQRVVAVLQNALPDAQVYLVGGVVRDVLMGRTPGDVDVVVCGVPFDEVCSRLQTVGRIDLVGKRFGVIKFTAIEGPSIDVALPRTEHALSGSGHRRDFSVDFDHTLPIERDLERRDFTVNAMAALITEDGLTLVDEFGGREDMEKKLVRAVGDPRTRFEEDLSRMLRALRFALELKFEIEKNTWRALVDLIPRLDDKTNEGDHIVPREVVAKEVLRALLADPPQAFDLFDRSGVFRALVPELYAMQRCPQPLPWHAEGDVWQHTKLSLQALVSEEFIKQLGSEGLTAEVVVATLLHDVAKPVQLKTPEKDGADRIRFDGHDREGARMAGVVCKRLKLSSYKADRIDVDCERLARLIAHHLIFVNGDVNDMRHTTIEKYFVRDPMFGRALLALTFADGSASVHEDGTVYLDHWYRARERIAEIEAHIKKEDERGAPLVSGEDVMRVCRLPAGPRIGTLLKKVREASLAGIIATPEEAEIFLKSLCAKQSPVVVLSGASGVGKTTIAMSLRERIAALQYIISYTTRAPRKGELDGRDYHFTNRAQFKKMVDAGEMIEWAEVYGDFYGRSKKSIEGAWKKGVIPFIVIDVQGAKTFIDSDLPTYSLFIAPQSVDELRLRLEARGKDSPQKINERLSHAEEELAMQEMFDAVVVNPQGKLDEAIAEIERLVSSLFDKKG